VEYEQFDTLSNHSLVKGSAVSSRPVGYSDTGLCVWVQKFTSNSLSEGMHLRIVLERKSLQII